MSVKTSDQLFPHDCQMNDMRFSAYNPKRVSFYCIECGGRLVVRVSREEWAELFGEDNLSLNEKVLARAVDVEEEAQLVQARRARNSVQKPEQEAAEDEEDAEN